MRINTPVRFCILVAFALSWAAQSHAMPIYATTVTDSTASNFGDTPVLGAPDSSATNFYAENGLPGFVVVSFDSLITNGTGDDLVVHLKDWSPGENELFRIFASLDGISFLLLGESGPPTGGPSPILSTVGFDLASAGLTTAAYVKLENVYVAANPVSGVGPDIDAFEALFPQASGIPEPTTLALMTLGIAGIGFTRKKAA